MLIKVNQQFNNQLRVITKTWTWGEKLDYLLKEDHIA